MDDSRSAGAAGPVELTLAICTWNRAARLGRLLASVEAAAPRSTSWEVLVVDNNSTDATPAVVADFASRLPLRCVFERRQGSASARNRALAEARGDLVIFSDDDTTLDPGFLSIYAAAANEHRDASFFGGTILVRFEQSEPRWARFDPRVFPSVFAELVPDPERLAIDAAQVPYGANFAVRRAGVGAVRFDEALGVTGKRRINGEETMFMQSLLARGEIGRWLPDAVVHHWIPSELATPRHLVRYFVAMGHGRAHLRRAGIAPTPPAAAMGVGEAASTAASHLLHAVFRRVLGLPSWVGHLRLASLALGELQEVASTTWQRAGKKIPWTS